MPDRFGGGGDYSQTFAYLSDNYLGNLERQAELANERRESEQAARDTEAFAKYDAGKMTGDELLAYIRRRINQTAYDPKQQAEWKKALLEYTESINDGKALSAFERTNDYNGYIEYLRGKAASANPAERAQILQQINQLTDQRDSQNVTRGAERIMLQITKGKATYEDLLAFYKNAIKNTRKGSDIRNQIRSQITNVAQQVKANNLTLRKGVLDQQLAALEITPQQYGRRLRDLARSSGLQTTDPNTYNSWMTLANQSIQTVTDFGRLAEIDGMLMRGDITPQEAERLYYKEAERYKSVSPSDYQRIMNEGWKIGNSPVPGQTPLPNPGVLGLPDMGGKQSGDNLGSIVGNARNSVLRFITQLDGSEYGQVNCVYASAAMLAYAMGYRDKNGILSGGDLRYLSGDRSIGTNLDEAQTALAKLGITGLRNWNDRHIDFEKFKNRVGQHGQPAVLMGINNNLPDNLKAFAGAAKGHGVFIAAYDPKKKAFLWYDPAVSKNRNPNYNGVWVDESVVKNFGWGPSYSDGTGSWNFSGQVLFAPPGTLKGDFKAGDVKRPPIKYINVDDAPVRPETPKRYRGYNHRGPSTVEPVGNPAVDNKGRSRVAKGGKDIDASIDTVEEVQQMLKESSKRLEILSRKAGDGELDDAAQRAVDQEILDLFDRDLLYAEAAGLTSAQSDLIDSRTAFLAATASRNSIDAGVIANTAIRDAKRDWEIALADPDPLNAIKSMQVIKGRLQIINGVLQQGNLTEEDPLDDLSADPKVPGNKQSLDAIIGLLDMVTTPGQGPVSERMPDILQAMDALGAEADQKDADGNIKQFGNDLGNMVISMMDQRDAQDKIEAGTHVPVVNGATGGTAVVPLVPKVDWQTGTETMVPDFGYDQQGNPVKGIQVPVQTPTGVEMRWVVPSVTDTGFKILSAKKNVTVNGITLTAGVPLTEAQMNTLGPALTQMIQSGQLAETPYLIPSVRMPDRKAGGKIIAGQTFYQDDSGGWYTGTLPVSSYGAVGGTYIGMDENLMPEFEYRPWATAGMSPLPFQGDRAEIQKAYDQGIIPPAENIAPRGADGRIDPSSEFGMPTFHTPYDPLSSAYTRNPTNTQLPGNTEADRADRIENALKSIFDGARAAEGDRRPTFGVDYGVPGEDPRRPLTVDTRTGPQTGLLGSNIPDPRGDRGFNQSGPMGPQGPQGSLPGPMGPMGPQGAVDPSVGISDLAGRLGLKLGGPMGPQGPQGPASSRLGPKGPQPYVPPKAKQANGASQKKSQSSLPKIGGSVMVGGTRIDVPSQPKPKQQTFSPPPPNTTGGGAAAASISMLSKKPKQTSKGAGGNYKS